MLVTIGSITTASRAANILRKKLGIDVTVIHTPSELNKGGCSYSIKFRDMYKEQVRRVVAEYKIQTKRWYSEDSTKEREYRDLS